MILMISSGGKSIELCGGHRNICNLVDWCLQCSCLFFFLVYHCMFVRVVKCVFEGINERTSMYSKCAERGYECVCACVNVCVCHFVFVEQIAQCTLLHADDITIANVIILTLHFFIKTATHCCLILRALSLPSPLSLTHSLPALLVHTFTPLLIQHTRERTL